MPVSLIETVRVRNGAAPLWYLHLRRLVASCKALGVPFPPAFDVPAGGADRIHRIEVGPKGKSVTEREVGSMAPVRLATSAIVHRPYPHKTTERAQFDSALVEARRNGADDGVLLTAEGFVAEGSVWGIFWWEGEGVAAPALELGVLPGVARARIAELMSGLSERKVRRDALQGAPVFLANAARGIVDVVSWDGVPVPLDDATEVLRARFWG
jgi:branched-subunit amino acid aminotransferase/4-amino-4-deoxychorismate lyase